MGNHIVDGEFQSDKYPTTPRGKVPLSVHDQTAQDLLWEYAQRRRVVDAEFAADLETALITAGYQSRLRNALPDDSSEAPAEQKLTRDASCNVAGLSKKQLHATDARGRFIDQSTEACIAREPALLSIWSDALQEAGSIEPDDPTLLESDGPLPSPEQLSKWKSAHVRAVVRTACLEILMFDNSVEAAQIELIATRVAENLATAPSVPVPKPRPRMTPRATTLQNTPIDSRFDPGGDCDGPPESVVKIVILKCPTHGFMCVSINDFRITPRKCCGSWMVVRNWDTTVENLIASLTQAGLVLP